MQDFNYDYNIYQDMQLSKFHIGYPVDVPSKNTLTKYFLIYPENKHRLLKLGKTTYENWKKTYEPDILKEIVKVLPVNKFLFVRKGEQIPSRLNTSSASLAFVLSSLSTPNVLADNTDNKSPIFLFSSKFKIEPKDSDSVFLESVTEKNISTAKQSLLNKWRAVEELFLEKRKVVLFLHDDDAVILKEALETKGIHINLKQLSESQMIEQQQYLFWKTINLNNLEPEIFSLKDGDFKTLCYSLGINFEKIEKKSLTSTLLKAGGILGGLAATGIAGYLLGKNKDKE